VLLAVFLGGQDLHELRAAVEEALKLGVLDALRHPG
jgi:hypothetical protein